MRRRAGLAVLALAAGTALSGTGAATAATSTPALVSLAPSLTVRRIDTRGFPIVKVDVTALGGPAARSVSLKENGKVVGGAQSQSWETAARAVGTVLVIDTAASMAQRDKLLRTQAAAKAYIAKKPNNELIAVVAAGADPRVVVNFTADVGLLNNAIDHLGPLGEQSLYDGIRAASALFADRPELLSNVVVVSDRADGLSRTTYAQAQAAIGGSKASVFVIGLSGSIDFAPSLLRSLAGGGGQYLEVPDPTKVGAALDLVHSALAQGVELTYTSKAKPLDALDITVDASGLHLDVHTVPGAVASGSSVTPESIHLRQAPGVLRDKVGVVIIALMVLAAAGLFVFAVLALVGTERNELATALQPYQDGGIAGSDDPVDDRLAQTAFVARAVATTGRFAEERGILERVETMLVQADLSLRPAEALFFYLVSVLLVVVLVVFTEGIIFAFFALIVVGLAPPAVLSFLAGRRLRKFTGQLPDTLQLLSSSLRAGFSFLQGVEAVADESRKPMSDELHRVIIEARLGRPLEEALQDCADRMKSPDFDWAVMAVRIQREVGGNLAELLQTVGETMIERERLRRDVKSLTAEGRVSAIVLGIMPPALGAIFYVTNPTYMNVLFTHIGGQIALATATIVAIGGFIWMKKIVDIEV